MKRSQKGFATSVIIGAIVLVAVIVAGVFVYNHDHNKKNSSNPNATNTSTTSPNTANNHATTQATNPYAGWKTYTSTSAGYSIKYPSNWSLSTGTNNGGAEDVKITSPNKFQITALSFTKSSVYWSQQGSSGECGSSCQTVNQTTPVSISGYGTLGIDATTAGAGGGTANELLLLPSVHNTLVASPLKTGVYTTFSGLFQGMSQQQQTDMTSAQFLASSDTKTAISIYKSLSY